jgi:hypothetical protein
MSETSLTLFYHDQSQACKKLKEFIPKDSKIQYVNIQLVNNLPESIKSIPALIVNGKDVLLGKKVFDYFKKTDEMEYLPFSTKNSGFSFSTLDDDNVESNTAFSSIDAPSISDGIPQWNDTDDNKTLDLDKLTAERDQFSKQIAPEPRQ